MRLTASHSPPVGAGAAASGSEMPRPSQFDGTEQWVAGKQWVRYKLSVVNRASYSADLFTPAPYLAPCGKNTNASRAWVDIFDGQHPYNRLYGFCGLSSPEDLGKLWFALPKDGKPLSSVYITLTDRLTDRRMKETVTSNEVAISPPAKPEMASPPKTSLGRCDPGVHPDQRIAACTRYIEGGGAANETLASAYFNRCDAYGLRAI
jgi:hypothetical protein